MSSLRVTYLTNRLDDGPVEFSTGVGIPTGYGIDGSVVLNTSGIVTATDLHSTHVNVTGVMTAASFAGSGIGLTNLPGTPTSKAIAFGIIA